ncbi:MAG: hypothetical protein GY835_15850 [bacterium]|nr:hypothetical protein [bacterium]
MRENLIDKVEIPEVSEPEEGITGKFKVLLFIISSVLALVMRLLYLIPLRGKTLFDVPMRDSIVYVDKAREILDTSFWGSGVSFHSSPLYPYFLALMMGEGDEPGLWVVRVIQAVLSALTVGFLALIGTRLFGRGAGIATAILAIFYAPFLFYSGELLEITLTLFCLVIAVWLGTDEKPDPKKLLGIGLFLGLAAVGKPNLLLLTPVFLIGIGFLRPLGQPQAWPWKRGLILVLGVVLAIAPFTLRNRIVGGDWVLISSNGGINFFIGNNPNASGGFWVPSSMQQDLENSSRLFPEKVYEREMKPSEASRFWAERAFHYYRTQPGDAARKNLRKLGLLLGSYEIPNHYSIYFFKANYSPLLRVPLVWYSMVLPFAMLGLVFGMRRKGAVRVAGWSLIVAAASVVLFFVTSRYRLPMLIWMLPFAGAGIMILLRILQRRRWRLLPLPAIIIVASLVILNLPLVAHKDFHDDWITLGTYWAGQENWEKSAQYNSQALREKNMNSAVAWQNLGYAYFRLSRDENDLDMAEECLWKAIKLDQTFGYAYGNLANFYYAMNRIEIAKKCLERAFLLDPSLQIKMKTLHSYIGPRMATLNERNESFMKRLEDSLADDPGNLDLHIDKAHALAMQLNRLDDALAVLDALPSDVVQRFPTIIEREKKLKERIARSKKYLPILDTPLPAPALANPRTQQP